MTSCTAPAHPHATRVTVYLALFFFVSFFPFNLEKNSHPRAWCLLFLVACYGHKHGTYPVTLFFIDWGFRKEREENKAGYTAIQSQTVGQEQ